MLQIGLNCHWRYKNHTAPLAIFLKCYRSHKRFTSYKQHSKMKATISGK